MAVTIDPTIFREYDIRGVVETQFGPDVVRTLGRALAQYFLDAGQKEVLVGRDNRLTGPALRDALIEGLAAEGCQVTDLGVVISPAFYWARLHLGIDAGVMLTASHNPPEFNGMKIALGPATIYGEQIQEVRRRAEALAGTPVPPIVRAVTTARIDEAYVAMLAEKITLGPRPLRVAVDCGNGTASLFAPQFLERIGCHVEPLYCTSDPTFPNHHPDPVKAENLVDLQRLVLEKGCDVGIAFDGDGDRLGVVDNEGNIRWGDELMILFWREILPRYPGTTALIEVKCSQALVDEVQRLGGKPMFWKTGHSLIKAKMREIGAVFTGEMSGHMFFADEYYGFDDALYAAGRLLRILSRSEQSLARMLADIPRYYSTGETRIPCADEDKFRVVQRLVDHFKATHEVVDVDGVRVLFGDGWGLARASNTQPAIVARCEGNSPEALERIKGAMEAALRQHPEVGPFEWA